MPNDIISSYTLGKSIGIGGNANVFLATTPNTEAVAIKILHPGKTSEEDIKRFQREFVVLKKLSHPNIISVFEVGEYNGYPWMAMELAENGDISNLIAKWRNTTSTDRFSEIRALFVQICSALETIHQAGMIHRDLKPSNILLTQDNTPKITDFGGVKAPKAFQTELTQMGKLVGTVAFMAPEQILGDTIDKRADLYSLGMILYICLTGQRPFEADNITGYLSKHITEMPPHPQKIDPQIPADLADVCFKLLQKDPYKRYSSAKQVKKLLQNQSNLPVLIGRRKQFEQIDKILQDFIQKEQSSILCLLGPTGVGRKDFIKYIVHQLKRATIPISTELQHPPPEIEKYSFWIRKKEPSPEFLKEIKSKIKLDDSVFFLVTRTQQLKLLEKYLPLLSFTITIPPLALSDTQDLLRQVNITGKRNVLLSKRLQFFFKGRQEYIQQALSDQWLKEIEATPFKTLHQAALPIPESLREQYLFQLKKLSKKEKQLLECMVIYQTPASQATLLRISGQDPQEFLQSFQILRENRWIATSSQQEDTLLSLASHLLENVLIELVPKQRKISWHKRIAAILQKQYRLSLNERIQLSHHLKESEQFTQVIPLLFSISEEFSRREQSEQSAKYLSELLQLSKEKTVLFSSQDLFTLYTNVAKNHITQAQKTDAGYYFSKALSLPDISETDRLEALISSCLLAYSVEYSQEALRLLPPEDTRRTELLKQQATHSVYHFDFETAEHAWKQLQNLPFREAQINGKAGEFLLQDWGAPTSPLWDFLDQNLLDGSFTWIVWHVEHCICCGQWLQALRIVRTVLPHVNEHSYKYLHLLGLEAWIQTLVGQTVPAKQILNQLEEKIPSPCSIEYARVAILLLRAQSYLGISNTTLSINWESYQPTIDDLSTQEILVQRSNKLPSKRVLQIEIKTPLIWLRDILLCDQALSTINTSQEQKEELWSQVHEEHHAIQLMISLHFSRISQSNDAKIFWGEKHQKALNSCIKTSHDLQYNFQNWKK